MREALLRFGDNTSRCVLVVENPANILSPQRAIDSARGGRRFSPRGPLILPKDR
jgi:hypothetical protein